MQPSPTLTPEENFRLYGALHPSQVEQILDASAQLEGIKDIDDKIREGMAQFPAEDFLADVISDLAAVINGMRKNNAALYDLKAIAAKLEDIAQTTFDAADYGRSELKEALTTITGKPQ
jgi:hypothetical protein